jgi:hypothetical protein
VLFERGRSGQRGGVEPGRHRDDHQRTEQHGEEQQDPAGVVEHMRQQPHQKRPEREDADRHRDRIDHRGEEDDRGVAIEQFADAEIGVDAAGEGEDADRDPRGDLEALDAVA